MNDKEMRTLGALKVPSHQSQGLSHFPWALWEHRLKVASSENELVARGLKAIGLILQLTQRAPTLIKQSHLEDGEGLYTHLYPKSYKFADFHC
jgi:hypothetical protein